MAVQAKARPRLSPTPGQYITDGSRLYHIEELLPNREGVVIEDCKSLEHLLLSFDDFKKAKFEKVGR